MRIVVRLIIGLIVVIAAAAVAIYAIVWPPAPLALPAPGAVLDGVTLEVAAGEFFGLVGINGAGKTTLLKCLLDFARADAGTLNDVTLIWPAPFVPARTPIPLYGNVVMIVPGVPASLP